MLDENQQKFIEVKTSLDSALSLINNLKEETRSNTQRLDELNSKILSLNEKFAPLDDIIQWKNETIHSLEQIQVSNQQLDQAKNALDGLKQVVSELEDSFKN
ncbi:MAG: hypothetical protein ACFE9L_08885 [Candidatus Hodarchaeota archaeon]